MEFLSGPGGVGALTASYPLELILDFATWRQLFIWLAAITAILGVLTFWFIPSGVASLPGVGVGRAGFREIAMDARFWRVAPLSSIVIGTAWSLQGLWAAPWLRDAASLGQNQIALHLSIMALALLIGALGFGILIDYLRPRGIEADRILVAVAMLLIGSETAMAMALPIPTLLSWSVVGLAGAATVLSYSHTAKCFNKALVGRVNSALNLLHFGSACLVQFGFGLILELWPKSSVAHYDAAAYKTAFLVLVSLKCSAVAWFIIGGTRNKISSNTGASTQALGFRPGSGSVGATSSHPNTLAQETAGRYYEEWNLRRLKSAVLGWVGFNTFGSWLFVTAVLVALSVSIAVSGLNMREKLVSWSSSPRSSLTLVERCPLRIGDSEVVVLSYEHQKDVLEPSAASALNVVVGLALNCINAIITVVGHTDSRGGRQYNEMLSRRRAEMVSQLIEAQGISPLRVSALGEGASKPRAPNSSREGRARNRRVVITVRLRPE